MAGFGESRFEAGHPMGRPRSIVVNQRYNVSRLVLYCVSSSVASHRWPVVLTLDGRTRDASCYHGPQRGSVCRPTVPQLDDCLSTYRWSEEEKETEDGEGMM